MYRFSVTEPNQRRCVLPFKAEPPQLAGLRRTVRAQLAAWGMSPLVDEAQLAVTELASNVIKHVGEGTAATLVLDAGADQLRVELHDKSRSEPQWLPSDCNEECGRGLHLLVGMAAAWGTIRTAAGKAVWCELALPPDENRRRIQRAVAVMETYGRTADLPAAKLPHRSIFHRSVLEESAASLIIDLLHWVVAQGLDPDDILDRAQMHFEADLPTAHASTYPAARAE
ncbi:ATP-binding protein [Streptomyces sp. ME19-01-6]|uniref:ATP-binding protein n=1 Tax=Streptomyces sp. ME19-01-6 TaxID=3028686 RepID=UPI0029BE0332|nr:ATP-binding protein [Streptomyces sp. ME19-01-6]MDX3231156.1 ATP-binding protein [Streptomyces sp. ME19-01-6]